MVHYLPLTISNRTATPIRVTHDSFIDLVPAHQTTPPKAIKSDIKIRNLKVLVFVDVVERPNEIQIRLTSQKRLFKKCLKRFWRLDVDYRDQQVQTQENVGQDGTGSRSEKGKRPRFEVFESISDEGLISLMVLKARDFESWMSNLSDEPSISSLTLPGSHQTCALYGWPIGTCHTRPLSRQLKDGIRFIDIRLALPDGPNGALVAYHGFHSQLLSFQDILRALINFLNAQPTETVIVSIKQEDHTPGFDEALVKEMIAVEGEEGFRNRWWLDCALPPSLGQARGKLVLFSRIIEEASADSRGIRLPVWPNNAAHIWETKLPNAHVAVQDWYDIGSFLSISKKSSLACVSLCRALHEPLSSGQAERLDPGVGASAGVGAGASVSEGDDALVAAPQGTSRPPAHAETESQTWVITFLSASALMLAFPVICAKGFGWPKVGLGIEGVNSRVARWLVSRREEQGGPSVKGVVCLMDYYQSPEGALVSLLVDCNF